MTSSLALNFFLKGCNWYLQIKCAPQMWYIMDYGRTRTICAYITFACSLSHSLWYPLELVELGGRGWGKGDVTQEPSPRNTDTNSLLQFLMFCPIIFGPSAIPAIHMCTIHKSYTYTCNFCFSPYYIEYSKFLAFLCGNFYKEASQDLTTQPFRLRGFFSLVHPM